MITIDIQDVQRDLFGTIKRVTDGETFVIMQTDKAVAEIKPVPQTLKQPRPFGLCAGEFVVPDDFDAPLPEDILRDLVI